MVRLHRSAFLHTWPKRSRGFWLLINCYSLTLWYGFHGWRLAIRCFFRYRGILQSEYGISHHRHLFDLFRVIFLNGIFPYDYYRYQLFRRPEKQWLTFIYDQELPYWHQMFSPQTSEEEIRCLNDKLIFAQCMEKQNIPCIPTAAFIPRGSVLPSELLLGNKDWLLKPRWGNQAKGIVTLCHDSGLTQYRMATETGILEEPAIQAKLRQLTQHTDYLVQPLLHNRADMARLCHTNNLCVLRIVSVYPSASVLYATLEIPDAENRFVYALGIDTTKGTLLEMPAKPFAASSEYVHIATKTAGQAVPGWKDALDLCIAAHRAFPNTRTIGWDVAVSTQGVFLIEGNLNWAVGAHQALIGQGGAANYHEAIGNTSAPKSRWSCCKLFSPMHRFSVGLGNIKFFQTGFFPNLFLFLLLFLFFLDQSVH